MQERGVEPLHLSVQDPKSCASANSATPATPLSIQRRRRAFEPTIAVVFPPFDSQPRIRFYLRRREFRPSGQSQAATATAVKSRRRSVMARPVTLFTGQWADLPFETICQK